MNKETIKILLEAHAKIEELECDTFFWWNVCGFTADEMLLISIYHNLCDLKYRFE